jgi:hypothetical protein
VEPIDQTAARAIRQLLATQPLTTAKVEFAWKIAAGPALARSATVVSFEDGRLGIRAKSAEWQREIARARPMILQRIAHLIGPGAVRMLTVSSDTPRD